MAKKYTIQLEVDDSGAIKNVDKLAGELDTAAGSAQNLKQQLREMQQQISSLDSNSEEFQKLSREAGELKDRIKDASEAINNQAGSSFERLSNNAGQLKDSLLNLDFEQVGSSLQGIAGTVKGFTFKEFGDGLKNVTSGIGALGKALLTNPLFLIITSATLIIANFEKIVSLFDGVTDAQQAQAAAQQKAADAAKSQYDQVAATENTLKLQGKTEKEILDLKKQALDTAILEQRAAIESQQVILNGQIQAAERNKSILKGILDFITAPIQILLKGIDSIGSAFGQDFGLESAFGKGLESIASQVFDPAEVKAEGEKTIAEAKKQLADLENTRAGIELQEREARKKAAADKAADAKAAADKATEDRIKAEQEVSDLLDKLFEENVKEFEDAERKKTEALQAEADKRKQAEEVYNEAINALRAEQEAANRTQDENEIKAIDEKYAALREKAIAAGQSTLEIDAAYKAALEQQEKISAEQRQANEQAVQDAKLQSASDALGAINNLISAFTEGDNKRARAAFNIQKAISIAQATVDTYKGANAIFASAAANPKTVLFPAQPFIAAGAAIAAGLANVAVIARQKFQGGGGGGGGGSVGANSNLLSVGGGGGGGAVPAGGGVAQFNPVNTDFVNNRPDQPTRAYVIATDVRSGVEASEKVEQQARL